MLLFQANVEIDRLRKIVEKITGELQGMIRIFYNCKVLPYIN